MKKIFSLAAIILLLSLSVFAQSRPRIFDNFDTKQGVQVVTPTIKPIENPEPKKLVKKTAQSKMGVQEGFSTKDTVRAINYVRISMAAGTSLNGFTTGDATVDSYILDSSKRYGIDPLLIYAQMHQESSFKQKAISHKGARGLMQLMPPTAARFGVTDIYNPKQNIEGGVKYMRWLLDKFNGDVILALAGYNAGEGAVMKYGWQVPPYRETQEYVRRIAARYSSISNPNFAKTIKKVSNQQVAELEKKEAAPLTVYETNAMVIKTPDGRMRLVSQ